MGPPQRRSRAPRKRRPVVRILLGTALVGVLFALGVALGQATAEDPASETAVTSTRVIVPVAAARETVTVTTTVTSP